MLAMVIRVMIGCVSTNHKSDCEIWPNSFLAAPVSRGEKCLMRSFPHPPSPPSLLSSFFFSPFSPLSQSLERRGESNNSFDRKGGGNLEICQGVEKGIDTSLTRRIPWTRKRQVEEVAGYFARGQRRSFGGKVTSG